MTRKDYIAIAEALRRSYALAGESQTEPYFSTINAIIKEFSDMLHADNPRFDREHFLAVVRGKRELQSRPPRKHNNAPNKSCGSCGADIGPSTSYPWHGKDDDCRAVRQPIKEVQS